MTVLKNDTLEPPPCPKWRDRISLLVTLIAGSVLTLLAGSGLQQAEALRISERQAAVAQVVVNTLQTELTRTSEAVRNAGLMIEANPQLTREQFNRHMQNVVENQLSVNLIEWQPIVPAGELAKFEAAARMTGLPDFQVVQPDTSGQGWEPVHGRSEYVPVRYFWPERYRTGGLDMSFSPERMASKLQSRTLRQPVASGVFDFIKEGKTQTGTLAMAISAAVFGADGTAKGYLAAVVDVTTLFQSATRLADSAKYDLLVFGSVAPDDAPIYTSFGADSDLKQASTNLRVATTGDPSATVEVAQQSWRLVLHPRPAFYAEVQEYGSLLAFFAGMGMTLLLMLYLYQVQNNRRTIERAEFLARNARQEQEVLSNRLQEAQRIAHVGSWQLDLISNRLVCSDEMFRIFEIDQTRFEATYEAFLAAIHPEDRDVVNAAYAQSLTSREPYGISHRLLMPDGRIKYVHERCESFFDTDGKPLRSIGTVQDITERKRIEQALQESENHFRNMYEYAPLAYQSLDIEGNILDVNQEWLKQLGYERQEVIGHFIGDFITAESIPTLLCEFPKFKEAGRVDGPLFEVKCKDGSLKYMEVNGRIGRDSAGNFLRTHCILTDVTLRKQMEDATRQHHEHLEELVTQRTRQLAQAKQAAETANVAKSAFLANMSHEIRTPLNAITGMSHLLRRSGLSPQQSDKLDKIEVAGKHLLEIINAVLDLSKIEAGKFALENVPVHVEALLGNFASMLGQKAKGKGLRFHIETVSLPRNLHGDPTRLQQALLNYAANAIKFTETGHITLRVKEEAQTDDATTLRFEVEDTGIGIAPAALSKLFGAFEQADNSTTRKYGGTGLGLAITRKIAEIMGGTAGVTSTVGQGSTFWFTAVLRKGQQTVEETARTGGESAEQVIQREHAGKRILLAEDEPINREIAQMLLENVGLQVDPAKNGQEAVEKARSGSYALILMDMQMPVLDGLDATRRIRQLSGHQKTPILAMTANAFAEDKARCNEAGMDDHISKPVTPEVLYGTLLKWFEKGRG